MDPITYLEAGGFTAAAAYLRTLLPGSKVTQYALTHLKSHLDEADSLFVANPKCRIWSQEHGTWWRANASGYASDPCEAGVYDFSDAWRRSSHCDSSKGIVYEILEDSVKGS